MPLACSIDREATLAAEGEIPLRADWTLGEVSHSAIQGNCFNMGTWGEEIIRWRVLDMKEKRILLLAEQGIDCLQFNRNDDPALWGECTLSLWLNTIFFNTAFSEVERSRIVETPIVTHAENVWGSVEDTITFDHVFCLSKEEVLRYFPSPALRRTQATGYARQSGVLTSELGFCSWWLRSPGFTTAEACIVDWDGIVMASGWRVDALLHAVRPAMWIRPEEAS